MPEAKPKQVVTDGIFSIGEWDDALSYSIADKYNIYLKADSEILYIGLKSAKPIGECVCEIRITSNEKERPLSRQHTLKKMRCIAIGSFI
jgi:hypothetical protein